MAGVTALRDAAREAILAAGGRGFVRFGAEGNALLVSDAIRRCAEDEQAAAMVRALREAGFDCEVQNGLLMITPGDARLLALCMAQPGAPDMDWNGSLWEAQALCARLTREAPLPLDGGGRRLVVETARLLWQPKDKAVAGLASLRARIAVRLREGEKSGLYEAGRLLGGWLGEQMGEGGADDEA